MIKSSPVTLHVLFWNNELLVEPEIFKGNQTEIIGHMVRRSGVTLINKHRAFYCLSFFWYSNLFYVIKHLHVCNVHGCNYENKLPVSKPSFLKIKFFCSSQRNTMRSWEKFERGMRSRSKKWKRFVLVQNP